MILRSASRGRWSWPLLYASKIGLILGTGVSFARTCLECSIVSQAAAAAILSIISKTSSEVLDVDLEKLPASEQTLLV